MLRVPEIRQPPGMSAGKSDDRRQHRPDWTAKIAARSRQRSCVSNESAEVRS
jgi:hypothetical protein